MCKICDCSYTFPNHFPFDCPPLPHDEKGGTFYRLVKNTYLSDSSHFRSYYELGLRKNLEEGEPCSRRAVSIFDSIESIRNLIAQVPTLSKIAGKFIAMLDLPGDHGVVKKDSKPSKLLGHHDWWIPNAIDTSGFCKEIVPVEG